LKKNNNNYTSVSPPGDYVSHVWISNGVSQPSDGKD